MTDLNMPSKKLTELSLSTPSQLIAYDGSGSTMGRTVYHKKSEEILKNNPNAEIVLWDHEYRQLTREEMASINTSRQGFGGTNPAAVADYVIHKNFHGDLVIITDGQCGNASIDVCSEKLGNSWHFDSVICYLIRTGVGLAGIVNQSVTCPFTRNASKFEIILIGTDGKLEEESKITEDDWKVLETVDNIKTIGDFEEVYETLKKTVIAKTMGLSSGKSNHNP
jgi:hypothetical protein